ncbi:hypothetical protein FQN54_003883 [Arachnomyces sp. PD_36]|nr:hypothetical protein FQN54_003883 [Arachnomyces sp. PD_36]
MSYPNQNASPEPSTSQKAKQKAPSQQPPAEAAVESSADQILEIAEPPPDSSHLSSNIPPFKPFFTLIEDAHSSDHHNPTVHYIFSDDDTDLITEAALRALEPEGAAPLPPGSYDDDGDDDQDDRPPREPKHSSLPPQIPGVQEHYVVLDMQPSPAAPAQTPARTQSETATTVQAPTDTDLPTNTTPQTYTVTSAHSLNPTWQVLNTELSPAPTFETSPNQGHANDTSDPTQGGLMLKIKGTAGFKPGPTRGRDKNQASQDQNLEDMMEQFEKRMDELRRVIEAGDAGLGMEGKGEEDPEGGEQVEGGEEGEDAGGGVKE